MACLIAALSAGAAPPVLPHIYSSGRAKIRWQQNGKRVVGFDLNGGGPCHLAPNAKVITATWVDDLLVGSMYVCQTGPVDCHPKDFPLFAFYNPVGQGLSLDVQLTPGCQGWSIPNSGHLQLLPDTQDTPDAPLGRPNPPSHLERGERRLQRNRPKAALAEFKRALSVHEDPARSWAGIGRARLMSGRLNQAASAFRRSLGARRDGQVYYLLAKTEVKLGENDQAMASLQEAVKNGFHDRAELIADQSFEPLRPLEAYSRLIARLARPSASSSP